MSMQDKVIPYYRIPHCLEKEEEYKKAPAVQRYILLTIIAHACFDFCTVDDHGISVDLKPGQFMCTQRQLAELCNASLNDVQRCIKRFKNCNFVSQEVSHVKQILTILYSPACELIKKASESRFDSRSLKSESRFESQNKKYPNNQEISSSLSTREKIISIQEADEKQSVEPAKVAELKDGTSDNIRFVDHLKSSNSGLYYCFEKEKFVNLTYDQITSWQNKFPNINVTKEIERLRQTFCIEAKENALKLRKPWVVWLEERLAINHSQAVQRFKPKTAVNSGIYRVPDAEYDANKSWAEIMEGRLKSSGHAFAALSKKVEFCSKGVSSYCEFIDYDEPGFMDLVKRKFNIYEFKEVAMA